MPMPNSKWSRTIVHHIWKALLSRRSQTIPGATKTHECLKPASQASNQDPLRVYHPPHPPPAVPLLLVANSDLCLWCSANDGIGVLFPSVSACCSPVYFLHMRLKGRTRILRCIVFFYLRTHVLLYYTLVRGPSFREMVSLVRDTTA